jgi:FAD/FMN-containing dehydrogenase
LSDTRAELERLLGAASVGETAAGFPHPVSVAWPSTTDEVRACLAFARERSLRILPLGLGSKLAWRRAPAAADFALSTRRLAGGIEYEPGDGTLTARAGTPMATLAAVVAAGGHHLTPDVPRPAESTLGGVIAAGQSGHDRLRYGPVRHHVLGVEVALADGSVVRSGGRLVKNVTGFDLHRLFCGAQASLGIVLGSSMRLFALPERLVVLASEPMDARAAGAVSLALLAELWEPTSLSWTDAGRGWRLQLVLWGLAEKVEAEAARARRVLGGSLLEGERARESVAALRDAERPASGWAPLQVACLPARLASIAGILEDELGAPGEGWRGVARAGVATLDVFVEATRSRTLVATLRARLCEPGDAVRERGLDTAVPRGGVAGRMQSRLRAALDPTGLFASELGRETATSKGP